MGSKRRGLFASDTMRPFRVLVPVLLCAAASAAAEQDWWNDAWPCRHRLVAPDPLPRHVDAVAAEVTTFGRMQPDARDLRVATRYGVPCPHRVLRVGPGDKVRFLFRPVEGQRIYYAYFGNPDVGPAAESLRHRAGLVMEVRDLPEGRLLNAGEVLALWDASTTVQGLTLRPMVFDGVNPVGPTERFIARFRGHFEAGRTGTYRFFTASSDASVVRVDGRVIAQWGGVHHAHGGRRARFGGAIDLTAGLHEIEYFWVKVGADPPAAVLGWQRPDAMFPTLMPARVFLPVSDAKVGPIETRDGATPVDFRWKAIHHLERDGLHAICVQFREASGLQGDDRSFEWDLGDGVRAGGPTVRRTYFGAGERRVRLTVRTGAGESRQGEQRIEAQPVWAQLRPPRKTSLEPYQSAFSELDLATASSTELGAALALAADLGAEERLPELWDAFRARPGARAHPRWPTLAVYLADRFQKPPFCSAERAEQVLSGGTEVELLLRLADLQVNVRGDADAARRTLQRMRDMSPAQRRLHRILDGDAAAQGGETDEARRKYDQAGATIRPWDRRSEVRRAAVLFTAEDFVRRKEYATATEVLEQRLLAQPSERLDTRCLLTLGLAHAGCGYAQKADVLLRRALAIDPRGADAPRVLLGLADTRRTAGDAEAAKAHEEALLERFPYSEEAALIHARRKGIQTRNGTALR